MCCYSVILQKREKGNCAVQELQIDASFPIVLLWQRDGIHDCQHQSDCFGLWWDGAGYPIRLFRYARKSKTRCLYPFFEVLSIRRSVVNVCILNLFSLAIDYDSDDAPWKRPHSSTSVPWKNKDYAPGMFCGMETNVIWGIWIHTVFQWIIICFSDTFSNTLLD